MLPDSTKEHSTNNSNRRHMKTPIRCMKCPDIPSRTTQTVVTHSAQRVFVRDVHVLRVLTQVRHHGRL